MQRAWPPVCAPESEITSQGASPLEANEETRPDKLALGGGRLAVAGAWLVVLAPLRPRNTARYGPPSCELGTVTYISMTKEKEKLLMDVWI